MDSRTALPEVPNQTRHWVDGESRERRDLETPGSHLRDVRDRIPSLADRAEPRARGADQGLPGGRESQSPSDAVKELDSKLVLQRVDRLGEGGLCEVKPDGSSGDALLLRDRQEVSAAALIHR